MKWFLKVIRQYADFKGRASREEYWMFMLFFVIASCVMMAIGFGILIMTEKAGASFLPCLFMFALLTPSWAAMVRRLHDTGRSAWFFLVSLIPVVGSIWLLIVLVLEGTPEHNPYGKNPTGLRHNSYDRRRSAAVALIVASACWLLLQTALFLIRQDAITNHILSLLLPVGLMIAGIVLFSKRRFSAEVAWSLIIVSVVWLLRDIFIIWNSISYLAMSFNILLIIDMLAILVPVALLLSGLFIFLKKSDYTVPVCLLFVGACIWILSITLHTIQFSVNNTNNAISEVLFLIPNMMMIIVPVSIMVLGRTLLSKSTAAKEIENRHVEPVKIEKESEIEQAAVPPVQPQPIQSPPVVIVQPPTKQPPAPVAKPPTTQPPVAPVQPQPIQPPAPPVQPPQTARKDEPPKQAKTNRTSEPTRVPKPSTIDDYRKKIVYLREDKADNNVWIVYKAPTKADAIEFLNKQRIARPSYYVVVETPEGNFGKDKDGYYQE